MESKYEAVFCIVNAGFSDDVMTAARRAGAGGGTVLKGRGSAPREAEELFRITIQPEKEVVMLLVSEEIKDRVLRAIYDAVGLGSAGQGIAFSLPIEKAVGFSDYSKVKQDRAEKES